MPRPPSRHPTDHELQLLKVLWEESPLRAKEVQQRLAGDGRRLAKTTVITTLNTMVDKGYLSRKRDGNAYRFSALVAEADVAGQVLEDVVDRVFDGSSSAVLLKLLDVKQLDPDELKELRQLINRQLRANSDSTTSLK